MNILVLTGFSAVGKSSVGRVLSERLDYELISVKQIVRTLAESRGYTRIRSWAQSNIDSLSSEYRQEVMRVIGTKKDHVGIIVDDIFDKDLLKAIQMTFTEADVHVIALDVSKETREKRMAQRLSGTVDDARVELAYVDGLKKGAGIEEVIRRADTHILNEGLLEDTITNLIQGIEGLNISYRYSRERI